MSNDDFEGLVEEVKKLQPKLMSSVYSATLFSASMLVTAAVYALVVVFFIPTASLESEQWLVFSAFEHLGIIMLVSVILMPFVILFQLITGVCLVKRRLAVECVAFLLSVLFCALFFWPGIFI
ncbi:hypothetical protein PQO03_01955 [Lentisphaera profundi]|uniref:Yip1 domain-containing protein n=1 Tax=Lentisphaera profundi TaxID=1658616 RepID=A0ABY7VSN4_9BACT|nr:hypothetical protein [Lentisphaera profundi]WDE96727.1 hypothetical protein PQO03_01955 [Lentisphaera profundi]